MHPIETMTLGDIIAESSNIGAALVANEVGNDQLGAYMQRFGYGQPTGIGFPGEASGVLLPASQWDEVIRATVSYGQGISVTPMQMADVYATIANGGRWVQPRLVRGFEGPDGTFSDAPEQRTRRVVSPTTADLLTRMLAYVVEDGTGAEAQIPGYQVAGKTGTSRKLDDSGHYVQRYMASFVGFLPASDPKVVIAVSIDEPRTVYGGLAAAPSVPGDRPVRDPAAVDPGLAPRGPAAARPRTSMNRCTARGEGTGTLRAGATVLPPTLVR